MSGESEFTIVGDLVGKPPDPPAVLPRLISVDHGFYQWLYWLSKCFTMSGAGFTMLAHRFLPWLIIIHVLSWLIMVNPCFIMVNPGFIIGFYHG